MFEWQYCIDGETPNIDILLNKLKWSWSTVKRELISCSTEITYMKSTRPKNHPMMDTADNVNSKQPNGAITQVKFCLCRHNIYTHTHTCVYVYITEREFIKQTANNYQLHHMQSQTDSVLRQYLQQVLVTVLIQLKSSFCSKFDINLLHRITQVLVKVKFQTS